MISDLELRQIVERKNLFIKRMGLEPDTILRPGHLAFEDEMKPIEYLGMNVVYATVKQHEVAYVGWVR